MKRVHGILEVKIKHISRNLKIVSKVIEVLHFCTVVFIFERDIRTNMFSSWFPNSNKMVI